MKRRNPSSLTLALLATGAFPLSAMATPPSTSPYVTDPQNAYVQDATSEGISNLNMVLCIMGAMNPADMVNQGNYIALVDKNKCDSKSQSSASNSTSGSSGASSAPDYMTATVDVTRATNNDPMIGNVWMSMTEQGQLFDIYVHVSAEQSPTEAPPYGKFRLDYIGKVGSTTQFNGFIDANGANVDFLETDPGSGGPGNALSLTATSTTAASGTMQATDWNTNPPSAKVFNFAYDSSETNFPAGVFRRFDGTHDVCFDRSRANAKKSVWRYGTYDATTGERVDQAHPGFPVQANYGGQDFFGFASYWGVNFQGLDVASDASITLANVVVKDQRPNQVNTTYTLSKSAGKLTKWTQNLATLADIDGFPFFFWGDLSTQTSDNTLTMGNWEMHWDDANAQFVVTGTQNCGQNGCFVNALQSPATVTGSLFNNMPIAAWSESFGGNINIPPTGNAHLAADHVFYYTQSDVIPGTPSASGIGSLYCLNNCPTDSAIQAFVAQSAQTPFGNGTGTQWNSAASSVNTVTYGFDNSGLTENNAALAISDPALFSGQFQFGVQSGRLFSSALSNADCPPFMQGGGAICEPPNPNEYYTWQTGPNPWNQSMWLTKASDSSVVTFDPPENIAYTVPSGGAYGNWAGKTIQLQFNGFGNVNGIPGGCVNPTDNTPANCGPNTRYVPEFSLPDGAMMTLTSNSQALLIKALDSEMRLAKVNCGSTNLAQPTTTATLPTTASLHDPSNSSDATYVGTKPTVTDPPKVIHGVIQ